MGELDLLDLPRRVGQTTASEWHLTISKYSAMNSIDLLLLLCSSSAHPTRMTSSRNAPTPIRDLKCCSTPAKRQLVKSYSIKHRARMMRQMKRAHRRVLRACQRQIEQQATQKAIPN